MHATSASRGTGRALLVALAIAALLAFLASRSTLWDRDEPRFAQATVEMLASGNTLYPTFDGELRPDKPIGIYWLMAIPMRVLGASALSARIVACLGLACAALATFAVARRLFGERAGSWSMAFLATAPLAVAEGTLATTDAVLCAAITSTWAAFVLALLDGARTGHVLAIAASLAVAQLVKGPVGLAVPALSIASALVLLRRDERVSGVLVRSIAIAAAASVLFFLAWAVPANAATDGEFARRGLGHHVVERVRHPLEGHGAGGFLAIAFYLPIVLLGAGPALAFLPAAWMRATASTSARTRLLLAWTIPPFAMFSLVGTKLPHYVLPIWPGLAVAAAAIVTRVETPSRASMRVGSALVVAVGLLVAAALLLVRPLIGLGPPDAGAVAAATVVLAATIAGWIALRNDSRERAAATLVAGQAASLVAVVLFALPAIEATKVAPRLAAEIRARVPRDVPIARSGFLEPSLDFALDRAPLRELDGDDAVRAWLDEPGRGCLVIPRDRLARAKPVLPPRASEIASVRGFDVSKGRALEVVALLRRE